MKESGRHRIGWGIILIISLTLPAVLISQVTVKKEIGDALAAGDTAQAISLLNKDIELDPSLGYNYYLLGKIYQKRGNLIDAEKQFGISFAKDGKFYEGLYALGMVQLKLGKLIEAEKSFNTGLKKSKDMKAAFYNGLGLTHAAMNQPDKADKELRQAILLDSTIAEYHVNLGDVNNQMKVYPLAISEYEKALLLDTTSLDVYFHLAEACLEMKDYNCALEKLRVVLSKDSTHGEAWMKAGGIYYKAARSARNQDEARQRFKEAIGSYKKFIELSGNQKPDSTTGRAYYETAMAYLMIGGYAEAKQHFAAVLAIPVEPKDIYFYYARAFKGNAESDSTLGPGEFDSSLVYFNHHKEWVARQGDAVQSNVSEGELYRWMGEVYERLKDYQNTITYYTRSLSFDSTQERLLYGVAMAYNYLQDYKNALVYYRKRIALGVDERSWSIYYNAATCALYLAEKAEQDKSKGQPAPDSTAPPDPLAGVDFVKSAAEYLEKVVQYKPDNVKALGILASIYLYQFSDCARGVESYEKVLALEPDNCEALKSLGFAYFSGICQKNFTRALDYLDKALRCNLRKGNSENSDVTLLTWIAQTYEFRASDKEMAKDKVEAKKDYKLAYDWYLKADKYNPGNPAIRDGIDRVKFKY